MKKFIVVEEKANRNNEFVLDEIKDFVKLNSIKEVKIYNVYETEKEFDELAQIFNEYEVLENLDKYNLDSSFRYRQILGQFDQKEWNVNAMLKNMLGVNADLKHSIIMDLVGATKEEKEKFVEYYINNIEHEVVGFGNLDYEMGESTSKDLKKIEGFINYSDAELEEMLSNFSMDLGDIKLCRDYFKSENRDPSMFELNVIDTYWSDHCRHTTFMTELKTIEVEDGKYKEEIENTISDYEETRKEVHTKKEKKRTLMDLATINAKYAKKNGLLNDIDESDEVNACCININVDVDGQDEDYLLYFKNETHNHPTEIEPFGGAATCTGGGIRDPLSGRCFVHQAMRITGAKNPTTPLSETRDGKLPQRVICQKATEGNSDYANQIGQTAAYARDYYDDGFEAKRMELGALVGATPKSHVVRENPIPSDVVILLGADTGRDGLGAAVGSSKVQNEASLELQGAEVQKGNAILERKIVRLFRDKEACRMIKKCNDFGAGGVSVAVGELCDGLEIYLEKVPTKYDGMDPSEIALAESQERMAVVIAKENVEKFIELCNKEDLPAVVIADVTDTDYMLMKYNGEEVLKLKREFLDKNGAPKYADAKVVSEDFEEVFEDKRNIIDQLKSIENASQAGMAQNFDFTIGKNTILAPYGGKFKETPQVGMASKIPVLGNDTNTVSVMACGYKCDISKKSPYHGAYYAVLDSVAKAVCLGVKHRDIRLSFQEFYEKLRDESTRWGKPTGSLLGAFKAMKQLGLAAIGGKDSMSGSFEELDVPPSLFSFAVGVTKVDRVVSREFKKAGSKICLLKAEVDENGVVNTEKLISIFDEVEKLIGENKIKAISTLDDKTVEVNVFEMALGNRVGAKISKEYLNKKYELGFIVETSEEVGCVIGETIDKEVIELDREYTFEELSKAYYSTLEKVYKKVDFINKNEKIEAKNSEDKINSNAKVLIPVLTGIIGEYDLYESFKKYTNNVDFFVIKEALDYEASVKEFADIIENYDVIAFGGGSIMGNEPEYGKAIELLLTNQLVKDAIEKFIKTKKILAIGSSFAGFISAGLIEFGKVQRGTDIKILSNPMNKYISDVVSANVVKESAFSPIMTYSTALGSRNLCLELDENKYKDQIISKFNEFYEEYEGIDAMTDPSGHILGTISNIERFNVSGFVNLEVKESEFIKSILKMEV